VVVISKFRCSSTSGHFERTPHSITDETRRDTPNEQFRLLRFDIRCPNEFPPFLGFVSDEFSKLGRRHRHRGGSKIGKASLEVRVGESGVDLSIEFVDDRGGCVLGRSEALPSILLLSIRIVTPMRRSSARLSERLENVGTSKKLRVWLLFWPKLKEICHSAELRQRTSFHLPH
jgi:hypothetical protein